MHRYASSYFLCVCVDTDKLVMASQLEKVVVDKQRKTVVVINVALLNDSNMRKNKHKKLENYQGAERSA